jgi:hypothetical protein
MGRVRPRPLAFLSSLFHLITFCLTNLPKGGLDNINNSLYSNSSINYAVFPRWLAEKTFSPNKLRLVIFFGVFSGGGLWST